MKKSIIFTVSAVLGVTAIVAVSIFVPPAQALIGNNPLIIQNAKTFNPYTAPNAKASFEEALLGTNKINNGNYVLYVGSTAYADNVNFLFGKQENGTQYTTEQLATNYFLPLNGEFGQGISEQQKNAKNFAEQPEYLAYLNVVTPAEVQASIQYQEMVNTFSNEKPQAGMTAKQLQNLQAQQKWAQTAPSFSFSPGATYTNWEGKTVLFYNSKENAIFNQLVSFVQNRFIKAQAVNSSPGFVIGYHNGLPDTSFSPSFSTSNTGTQTFYTWLKTNYGKA